MTALILIAILIASAILNYKQAKTIGNLKGSIKDAEQREKNLFRDFNARINRLEATHLAGNDDLPTNIAKLQGGDT